MAHEPLWKTIRDTVFSDISNGHYKSGDKLPTEAQLAARFGVNRHTVRQALAALVEDGVIFTRRGAGAFVATTPIDYPIGKRVRFHQNLSAIGKAGSREITASETRSANEKERDALKLTEGEKVHVIEGISYADDVPLAVFRSAFPAGPYPDLLRHIQASGSTTQALDSCGVNDYTRASTRLTSKRATNLVALKLKIPENAPVLKSISINITSEGQPVEYGATWFAGDRVTLSVDAET